jgi:hypothetical protein
LVFEISCSFNLVLTVESCIHPKFMRIYPSPTAAYFWVDSEWTDLNIRLFDLAGRQVSVPAESDQSRWMLDVRNLSSGLYVVWLERQGVQASRLLQVLR